MAEMRAPLSAIHSMLDAVALVADNLTEAQQRTFRRVQHRTRALMDMVKDLHRYSMIRSPEEVIAKSEVCIGEIVSNTSELFREKARTQGLSLQCVSRPIWVVGNEELLRELVTNLVSNAVQYTPSGGAIEVEMLAKNEKAELRVADSGIGISETAREHIFEEFYRASEAKEFFRDGTGLGLAIVKRIIEMHEGSIEVQPRPAGGTVFIVELPLHRPEVPRK